VDLRVDVVIAGGGLIGTAIAWALAEREIRDVCVVDVAPAERRGPPPEPVPAARATFAQELNRQTGAATLDFLAQHAEELSLRPRGSLWLHGAEQRALVQERWGLEIQECTPAQLRARAPVLDRAHELGLRASFAPRDVTLDAVALRRWFRERAAAHGVRFLDRHYLEGVETTEQEPGRRRAVHLHVRALDTGARQRGAALLSGILTRHCLPPDAEGVRGRLRPGILINALGAWSSVLCAKLGVQALSTPTRRPLASLSVRGEALPEGLELGAQPLIVDRSLLFFCPEGAYTLAGCAAPPCHSAYDLRYDQAFYQNQIWPRLIQLSGAFEGAMHVRGRGTLRGFAPDGSGVLGWVEGLTNLIEAHSFAGGGLSHCFAVARGVAELLADGAYRTLDLTPLSPGRFRKRQILIEPLAL
jgi:FAD-dependent oxidoreductase domain-containing protein 1